MTNKMPDKIAIENTSNGLRVMRDSEVSMGMCYYYRSDKAILNTPDTITLKREEYNRLIRGIKNILSGEYRSLLKTEKCSHDKYGWEDCELCVIEYLSAALEEKK